MRQTTGAYVLCVERESSSLPLFQQIYGSLRRAILDKKLVAGDRLPSARTLARDVHVSRTTVEEAYGQLLAEGFVNRRTGSGTFVAAVDEVPTRRSVPASADRSGPRRLASRTKAMARHPCFPSAARPRAFVAGTAAVDAFPIDTWRGLVGQSLRSARHDTLGSSDPAGFLPLREQIAAYLSMSRGVACTPERIVVLGSSQQGLDLAARVLVDTDDTVWMEDPGYPGALAALVANGARLSPLPVDDQGMVVSEGIRRAPHARLAYVTPSHQYPLGVTMSLSRRLELLQWAQRQGAWIIEDDYDSEFRFDSRPLAAIQGIDNDQRVIYLGTFSKVMFPALRLAYAVLPEDLVDLFVTARGLTDGHAPTSSQVAMTEFLARGHFGAHVRRMRELYRERRDALVAAFAEYVAHPVELGPTDSGLHAVVYLPRGTDDVAIADALLRAGIEVQPLSRYCRGRAARPGLFLGYAALKPREVSAAVKRMAPLLKGQISPLHVVTAA